MYLDVRCDRDLGTSDKRIVIGLYSQAAPRAVENFKALVSGAKAWLSDTAVAAAETALQIHGGVGFTWEYDVHLHMRRSRCNAAILGDADHHRDRVATYMEESWVPLVKG